MFRVWSKKLRKYFFNNEFLLDCDGNLCYCAEGKIFKADPNDYVVERCLGLKDAYDNDIYEGEILEKIDCDEDDCKYDVATLKRFPRFWLENESFGFEGEDLQEPSNWKIVGDIHNNPERLIEVFLKKNVRFKITYNKEKNITKTFTFDCIDKNDVIEYLKKNEDVATVEVVEDELEIGF